MDKTILKKFAIESKVDLTKKIENRINSLYLDEQFDKEQKGDIFTLSNDKHKLNLTKDELDDREKLSKRINEVGKNQVIEEATFTWFNRIIAIRYMEINDFLPLTSDNQSLGFRVLSSKDNAPDPEILKFANLNNNALDLKINKEYYLSLDESKRFNYVLLLVCNKLSEVIPQVFDGRTDYIDVLMPDNLLSENGFISKLLKEVPEENFKQVEVIGWLYQYYNQTEKDKVISAKKAYKKNEIPYATQLFTPDWIVKYMVENSLGRYYIEHNGMSDIVNNWKYFIKDNINIKNDKLNVEKITFIDPCSGSGHILVYGFELLYQMYINEGYSRQDIPELILKNNLFGLDIDDRAGQLSVLSVLLKAREYDKNIFNKDIVKDLNVLAIQESVGLSDLAQFVDLSETSKTLYSYLNETFKDAKEIGSLLKVEDIDYSELIKDINNNHTIFKSELMIKVLPLIKEAKILSKKYDCVVTNPPYMNSSLMSLRLKEYIASNFKNVKNDMFSAFIIRNIDVASEKSYIGFMTPYVWMFISAYQELREYLLDNVWIQSLIQLEYSALEEATVPLCSFVVSKSKIKSSCFVKLSEYTGGMKIQEKKYLETINDKNNKDKYIKDFKGFKDIPNCEFIYWLNDKGIKNFKDNIISTIINPRIGLVTGDSNRFLRFWNEVNINNIKFDCKSNADSISSKLKWFPYQKGGDFKKWYGNNSYIINWEQDGYEIKNKNVEEKTGRVKSHNYNGNFAFKKAITWTKITSSNSAFRYVPDGFMFDDAGPICSVEEENLLLVLGLFNSKIGTYYLSMLNPTLNTTPGNLLTLPFIKDIYEEKDLIDKLVQENISISKNDWDSFETSWDFIKHPILMSSIKTSSIKDSLDNYNNIINNNFSELKYNEEELNKLFIDIYGLQEELTPEESDKDITIRKPDKLRDIKSFISYAVGCMFGRYSLDIDGLAYAGGEFDWNKYKTFKPDQDNIIPITDETYFDDDITNRFIKFVEVVFGKDTLHDNLNYIAETLGKRDTESDEDAIRRYFVNDFYNDHIKMYQKRPIYWLFDSGKKNGFKCLIYLHRYNKELVSKIRVDYLHKTQNTYEKLLSDVEYKLNQDISVQDVKKEQKRKIELTDKINECEVYEEEVADVANRMIDLDLDDGVKVNYDKFTYINPKNGKEESILAKIK